MSVRPIRRVTQSTPTVEGAGVKLRRAFGFGNTSDFDPFLLFDDFRNDRPDDYLAGFPWHPHRGIETITYVLAGSVAHGDSLGNRVRAGDEGIRFLLISGKPIEEPVAWYGPIVMNTDAELRQAYAELKAGTFIRQV